MECEAFLCIHKILLLLMVPKRLHSKCSFVDPLGFLPPSDCYARSQAGTRRPSCLLKVLPCRMSWQRGSQLYWTWIGSQRLLTVRPPASVDWQLLMHLSDRVT